MPEPYELLRPGRLFKLSGRRLSQRVIQLQSVQFIVNGENVCVYIAIVCMCIGPFISESVEM